VKNYLFPDIGDFEEVEVIEVLAKQGDQLNINDPVITIESDKSSVEILQQSLVRSKPSKLKLGIKFQRETLY
jgi:pyruvate dehydrogenase E1 component